MKIPQILPDSEIDKELIREYKEAKNYDDLGIDRSDSNARILALIQEKRYRKNNKYDKWLLEVMRNGF